MSWFEEHLASLAPPAPRPPEPEPAGPARICIIGGPRTGKTTLAAELGGIEGVALISADDHIGLGWSEDSRHLADLMRDTPAPWVAEGVAVVRAIRKRFEVDRDPKPCDVIILLTKPWVPLNKGQRSMTKGHETIWADIVARVKRAGIIILRNPTPETLAALTA